MSAPKLVLLVEDNPSDEKLTLRALQRCGVEHAVVVARDGAEAIDCLTGAGAWAGRGIGATVALILLDLKLPRIDGLEVLRRVRAEQVTRWTPVVVLTASGEEEDLRASYAAGANAYLRKPVDFDRFVEAARTICTFWLALNEPPPAGKVAR